MEKEKITKDKVKKMIDVIPGINKERFPAGNVNENFEMSYKDCNIEEQWIEFETVVGEKSINRIGSAHGGYLAGMLDEAMGIVLYLMRGDHEINGVTADMRFNFMKPLFLGDKIVIRSQVEHAGKQTAVTTAEIFRGNEKCAIAIETWTLIHYSEDLFLRLNRDK